MGRCGPNSALKLTARAVTIERLEAAVVVARRGGLSSGSVVARTTDYCVNVVARGDGSDHVEWGRRLPLLRS